MDAMAYGEALFWGAIIITGAAMVLRSVNRRPDPWR